MKTGADEVNQQRWIHVARKRARTGEQWPVQKQQKMTFGTADYESIFTYKGTNATDGVADFSVKATAKLKDQPKNPLNTVSAQEAESIGDHQIRFSKRLLEELQVKRKWKLKNLFEK